MCAYTSRANTPWLPKQGTSGMPTRKMLLSPHWCPGHPTQWGLGTPFLGTRVSLN